MPRMDIRLPYRPVITRTAHYCRLTVSSRVLKTLNLSSRTGLLRPSPTLAMNARAQALREQGHDIISLAAGEPDFNTPGEVCEAAIEAIHQGFTKYTPSSGMPKLKQAVAEKFERENGLKVTPEQIVVSCGAKHSIYNALMAICEPGDEVILLAPYWMTYADQIRLAGGQPKVVHTDAQNGFVPKLEQLEEAIGPRTRAMIINTPTNPTGAVLPERALQEIATLALRRGLWIVTDEIYERLTYGEKHVSLASFGPDVASQTITITGCSKTYAMTGWRIGFAAAPLPIAKAMSTLQDQVTSNPTSFAQVGAIAALGLPSKAVDDMRDCFRARRDLMIECLAQVKGLHISVPAGAFYLFPDFRFHLAGKISSDIDLADYLLDEALVATIPGSVFEGPGHLRLSYAASTRDIEEGVKRIADSLSKLE